MEQGTVSGGYKALQCPGKAHTGLHRGLGFHVQPCGFQAWVDPNLKGPVVRGVSDIVVANILRRPFLNISKQRNSWQG